MSIGGGFSRGAGIGAITGGGGLAFAAGLAGLGVTLGTSETMCWVKALGVAAISAAMNSKNPGDGAGQGFSSSVLGDVTATRFAGVPGNCQALNERGY